MPEEPIEAKAEEVVLTYEQKVELCNKEINEVLVKYGLTVQVAHVPQLVEIQKA